MKCESASRCFQQGEWPRTMYIDVKIFKLVCTLLMTKYIWSQILISRGRTMCTNEHMIAAKPNSVNTWIYHQIHQQIWQLWTSYAYNMPTFIFHKLILA